MDLNKRMKMYEGCYKTIITPRSYVIIRLDGKNFSTYTSKMNKPFDSKFTDAMHETAKALCDKFNAKFAYTQSDEISLLITEIGGGNESQPELGNVLQKLCSLTASVATAKFNNIVLQQIMAEEPAYTDMYEVIIQEQTLAYFDSRVFVVPNEDEVFNHMVWRQQDASRNSVSMAAHELLGHKATMNRSGAEKQEMMFQEKGVNWDKYPVKFKRGVVIFKEEYDKEVPLHDGHEFVESVTQTVKRKRWAVDLETPIFTKEREYLTNLIPTK